MAAQQEDYSTWDIVKATQYGYFVRCKQLVEEGYDVRTPDSDNITLLHWAAINNRFDIARYYISLGAVVDVLGGDLLATPLHWAIREGHLQMVVLLIQHGADPGVRDAEGCAAIHVAVQCGQTAIVAYLIAKGIDPDSYDANGKTPLMWSCWRTFGIDPTRTLLSLHAGVNMKDHVQHNTPLHWACLSQNTNVIMMLINSGADLDAKNAMGETPLDVAKTKKNVWITARIKMIRRERGMDGGSGFFQRLFTDKTFRQRMTFFIAFFALFSIGYIFELSMPSWIIKAVLFLLCYLIVYGLSMAVITPNEITTVLPLAISMATKFWVYMTSFVYFWSVVYSPLAKLGFFVFTPAMWYFFYKSYRTDPGFLACPEDMKKQMLVHLAETQGLRMDNICSSCLIVKPIRSKHCSVSKKCVAKFDHFCPWVCNAVGAGNHRYFIGYLFSLLGILSWNLYGAWKFWQAIHVPSGTQTSLEYTWYVVQYSPWVVWIFLNCVFHEIWVFILLLCQLYQIAWLGVTTNERMNAGRYHHFQTSSGGNLEHSPFNRGFFNNLADFFQCSCFGLLKPYHIDWKTKMKFEPEFTTLTTYTKLYQNV